MVVTKYVKETVAPCQSPGLGPTALGTSRLLPAESLPQVTWAFTWPFYPQRESVGGLHMASSTHRENLPFSDQIWALPESRCGEVPSEI